MVSPLPKKRENAAAASNRVKRGLKPVDITGLFGKLITGSLSVAPHKQTEEVPAEVAGIGVAMSPRRSAWLVGAVLTGALLAISLNNLYAQRRIERQLTDSDARLSALREQFAIAVLKGEGGVGQPRGTRGDVTARAVDGQESQKLLVDDIKRQLQSEMGLLPVSMLRKVRDSFVELNAMDDSGRQSYGTAGYLGQGYFITVKHAVLPLEGDPDGARKIVSVKIRYKNADVPARVIDRGAARTEVSLGDWAIIRVSREIDLPPLRVDTTYAYEFANPIFRMGNDYSKGIILSTGYVGQRMSNGLVSCLTDGHPGVSGGGVLDQQGALVGIPIGRMEGDYRFSFILPLRKEMFRKVPGLSLDSQ
jgi:hypothetical protein